MKRIFLLLYSLMFSISLHAQPNSQDERALRYLKEVEWPKAYREQDSVLLDRILADEFKMIDSEGNHYTKRDEIRYIRDHKPSYLSFAFNITRLEIFENNTAIVSGTGTIKGKDEDGDYTMTYESSNVLIKRGTFWKAVSSHTSGDKLVREK